MTQVKHGDTVNVYYTGKFGDGTVFDTSIGREPLEFTIGAATIEILAENVYGQHRYEINKRQVSI